MQQQKGPASVQHKLATTNQAESVRLWQSQVPVGLSTFEASTEPEMSN